MIITLTIFVCNEQLEYWKRNYHLKGSNSYVVYNGVDTDRFSPDWTPRGNGERLAIRLPEGAPVACWIAGFRPEKGHRVLLEAFSKIARRHDAHLLLAGDGVERDSIQIILQTA